MLTHHSRYLRLTATLALTSLAAPALAQSTIDLAHKFAWTENCGWMNWADAGTPPGAQSALVHTSFLSGFAWCENIGWINLGNGNPTDDCDGQPCYSTSNGGETGVNLDSITGELSGFAWGNNIGWINFSGGARATPPNPARLDPTAHRFRGYAWSENLGWINLNNATHFVGIACPADFNLDGSIDFFDYLDFVDAFSANLPSANFNHDAGIDFFDYLDFVDAFSAGC